MRRWLWLVCAVPVLAGCLNSRAVGQLIQPHTEFQDPHAWDCSQVVQMPMAQGGIMGGGLTECTRCRNQTPASQAVKVRDEPILVPPGKDVHLCVNGRVMVQGERIGQGSTRR